MAERNGSKTNKVFGIAGLIFSTVGLMAAAAQILIYLYNNRSGGTYVPVVRYVAALGSLGVCFLLVFFYKNLSESDFSGSYGDLFLYFAQVVMTAVTGIQLITVIKADLEFNFIIIFLYLLSLISYGFFIFQWIFRPESEWMSFVGLMFLTGALMLYFIMMASTVSAEIRYYDPDYTEYAVSSIVKTVMPFAIHASLFCNQLAVMKDDKWVIPLGNVSLFGFLDRFRKDSEDELDELYGEDTYEEYLKEKAESRSDRVRSYDEAIELMDELDDEFESGSITEEEYKKERQSIIDRI